MYQWSIMPIFLSLLLFFLPVALTAKTFKITATTSLIGDWLKNLSLDSTQINIFIPNNADPHSFEPSVQDILKLKEADLIFAHGLGMEPYMKKLLESISSSEKCIYLSESLKKTDLIQVHEHCCLHKSIENREEYDPHVWLNPKNVISILPVITYHLCQIDPVNASFYKEKLNFYTQMIQEIDISTEEKLSKIPPNKRYLVTQHNNFNYFAKRYNFEVVGTLLNSTSTDNIDPSAKTFKDLLQLINKYSISVLFYDPLQKTNIPFILSKAAKIKDPIPLYTESLNKKDGPFSYTDLINYNACALQKALEY